MVNDDLFASVEEVRRHEKHRPQHAGAENIQKKMQTTRNGGI
jgi:hypothetical protein